MVRAIAMSDVPGGRNLVDMFQKGGVVMALTLFDDLFVRDPIDRLPCGLVPLVTLLEICKVFRERGSFAKLLFIVTGDCLVCDDQVSFRLRSHGTDRAGVIGGLVETSLVVGFTVELSC